MDIPYIPLKVVFDYEYKHNQRKIQIVKGEKLFLLNKTNSKWWCVIRNSSEKPFYVPALYVTETDKNEVVSNDAMNFGSIEDDLHHPSLTSNIRNRQPSPENCLNSALNLPPDNSIIKSDYGAQPTISVSDISKDNVVSSNKRYSKTLHGDSSSDEASEKASQKTGVDSQIMKHDIVSRTDKRSKTPDLLGGKEKLSRKTSVNLGISSSSGVNSESKNVKQSERTVEKEKSKSSSWEKVLQKIKLTSPKQRVASSSQVDKVGSHPSEIHGPIKNKLAYSKSFETKHELKSISANQQRKSHLATTSWDGQRTDFTLKSEENPLVLFKNSSRKEVFEDSHTNLSLHQDSEDFQNPIYINQTADTSTDTVESSESWDGCLSEDEVSDSGTSFKSSELLSVHDQHNEVWNTIHEDINSSSCEEIDYSGNRYSVPVPSGWRKSFDEVTGEQCYINESLPAKWFSSTDHEGRVYYFEENSAESSWTLPKISIDDSEVLSKKSLPEVPVDTLLRSKDWGKRSSRITKAHSLLATDKKQRESASKSSSIPRGFLQDKSAILKEGLLNRTKLTENGKKVRKNWVVAHVVLKEQFLLFYRDAKSVQPEIVMQLNEAHLCHENKMSKRKNVFLVSTANLQVLFQDDDFKIANAWSAAIANAICSLDKSSTKCLLTPSQDEEERGSPLTQSRAVRNKNQDGSFEDQMSSNEEQQTKIRDRLKRFFHRRPTREALVDKGIYKDEPVFDNYLEKVCSLESPRIPKFVQLCINAIEGKEENMKADGLYRASGNLSHVQKIRLEVDQNNLQVLEKEDDVHVLTGALKLFFRELKTPLIPFEVFNKALESGDLSHGKNVRIQIFQDIVERLPVPNRDTLIFLLCHLRKVTEYEQFNRMHIPNLAIVFGPTLIWREKESHQNHQNSMPLEYMQQNWIIEIFLQQFDEIFKKFELPNS